MRLNSSMMIQVYREQWSVISGRLSGSGVRHAEGINLKTQWFLLDSFFMRRWENGYGTSPPLRAWPHCFHYGEHGLTLSI
jgi:hypothetical protein